MPSKESLLETPYFKANYQERMLETFGQTINKKPDKKFNLFNKDKKQEKNNDEWQKIGFKLPKIHSLKEADNLYEDKKNRKHSLGNRHGDFGTEQSENTSLKKPGTKIKILSRKLPSIFRQI